MRGPGYKLSGDVRRVWRCSRCGCERKLLGDVTSLECSCQAGTWMRIVHERIMVPRPIQRPSDVERRPIDFGIEAPPPAPPKPDATIIKPAISRDADAVIETTIETVTVKETILLTSVDADVPIEPATPPRAEADDSAPPKDDWGDGIL